MRHVEYSFDGEALTELRHATDAQAVCDALGHLSVWNLTFPFARIHISADKTELVAAYYKADPSGGTERADYVIGAVWRDDDKRFSFHS